MGHNKPIAADGFDSALKKLETIVQKLESGNIPLEESIELFEEGMAISRKCLAMLEEVEGKIEKLTNDGTCENV